MFSDLIEPRTISLQGGSVTYNIIILHAQIKNATSGKHHHGMIRTCISVLKTMDKTYTYIPVDICKKKTKTNAKE